MSQCKQTPGAWLGTRRRTDQGSQLMGVGTRSPTWILADRQEIASEFGSQNIPGPHHSWVDWCGKKIFKDRKVFLSVPGLNSQPWGCQSKSMTTQPICTQAHTQSHIENNKGTSKLSSFFFAESNCYFCVDLLLRKLPQEHQC